MFRLQTFLVLCVLSLSAAAQQPKVRPTRKSDTPLSLSVNERALQFLNRFTFGPRPGDLKTVLALTSEKWFESQLNPDSINDDVLQKRLNAYPTLSLSPAKVLDIFPDRGTIQQAIENKRPAPLDPLGAAVYNLQIYKLKAEQVSKKTPPPEPTEAEKAAKDKLDQATANRIAGELFALPKNARMSFLINQRIPDQIAFANKITGDQRNALNADFTPREREVLQAFGGGVGTAGQTINELAQAKTLRSILSERQLLEVMTDFWFNHFNIFGPKDSDQWYTTTYERDTIRPHALGKFRDLLLATAESPAMMIYLDNWLSIGPNSQANGVNPNNPKSKSGSKGLNENYGREVMELHTLGVAGGYTQADVTHLSAILTGWSVEDPSKGGNFLFDPRKHEPGTKQWFGYTIDDSGRVLSASPGKPAFPKLSQAVQIVRVTNSAEGTHAYETVPGNTVPDGMKQGVTALTLLAASPRTARFISFLLAQRFLADNPPVAVVDRMAVAYVHSDGDIKAVLRSLITSPEFNQRRFFRTKVKTPEEFVVSAFRTTATDPQNAGALVNTLADMGQPLYKCLPPTGYYITADHWMNTSALVGRLNFADRLTHNRFANQEFDSPRILALGLMSDSSSTQSASTKDSGIVPQTLKIAADGSYGTTITGSGLVLQVLEQTLIGGDLSSRSEAYIRTQLAQQSDANPSDTLNLVAALLLGSPDFQLH